MITVEKCRIMVLRSGWFPYLLWIIDVLLLAELFVPFPLWSRLFLWLVSVAINHFFTPAIIHRIFIKELEGELSFSGELTMRHFRPLPLYRDVLNEHKQLFQASCIPMAVEVCPKAFAEASARRFHSSGCVE